MCAIDNVLTPELIARYLQDMVEGKKTILKWEMSPTSKLYSGPLLSDDNKELGMMTFLQYEPNKTVKEDIDQAQSWDVFTTNLLTGCLFCAYRNGDKITVLHSNLCPDTEGLQQDRFKIKIQENRVTIIKDPNGTYNMQETIISLTPLEDILCCCYPTTTTIMEGHISSGKFLGYKINDALLAGYCHVFAMKGVRFYAVVKDPDEEPKLVYIQDKKQSGCLLI